MLDIDGLLSELESVIMDVVKLATERVAQGETTREYRVGDKVTVTTSFRVGFLDEALSGRAQPPSVEREPMVDVMRTKAGLKVLVLLPGVKKEDIRVFARERLLVFEINSRGRSYRKEIPCDLKPSRVTIDSMVQNNSVVEITFGGRGR